MFLMNAVLDVAFTSDVIEAVSTQSVAFFGISGFSPSHEKAASTYAQGYCGQDGRG